MLHPRVGDRDAAIREVDEVADDGAAWREGDREPEDERAASHRATSPGHATRFFQLSDATWSSSSMDSDQSFGPQALSCQ